jgi:adenylate cyclase
LLERNLLQARWKLEDSEVARQFVLFTELRAQGMTEYALRFVPFSKGRTALQGAVLSVATDRPGGFSDAEIDIVDRVLPALGVTAYRMGLSRVAAETLGAYLSSRSPWASSSCRQTQQLDYPDLGMRFRFSSPQPQRTASGFPRSGMT